MTDRPGRLSVSTDVGGTFTDVVVVDQETGEVRVAKGPTVPDHPVEGVVDALGRTAVDLADVDRFFHGTTIGINTLLQRTGAAVGFMTTRGFRDTLLIGRGNWPSFRLTWDRPEPLVPGRMSVEVDERVRADGTVFRPLDLDEVLARSDDLVAAGAEAIAVCFVNAYVAPEHEQRAGRAIRERHPHVVVCLSHELSRRYREFERALTAVGEAYLRPRMRHYFDKLSAGMEEHSFGGRVFITASDGGVMGIDNARQQALRTLVSGCASGVAGAAVVASAAGWRDVLAVDMGGTSFDAAIIRNGQPTVSPSAEVGGFEFQVPMINLATIGAGGGSIAYLDSAGGLHVGPESAGAAPGPACYSRGGTRPTFTDAALVAGLVPPSLLDGEMDLSVERAKAAIDTHVAQPLAMDVDEAAAGILHVVESKMAMLLEEMTVGNGLDPRTFTLFAYGGGGPLVAGRLAEDLGITTIVVPQHPGVFSAWGMQTLDVAQELSLTRLVELSGATADDLAAPFADLEAQAVEALAGEGFARTQCTLLRFVEMRYDAQEHTLLIPFDDGGEAALHAAFDAAHQSTFGFTVPGGAEIVAYRIRAVGQLDKAARVGSGPGVGTSGHPRRTRRIHHRGLGGAGEWVVVDRDAIAVDEHVQGPALIEESTTTTVVPQGWAARLEEGNLVLQR